MYIKMTVTVAACWSKVVVLTYLLCRPIIIDTNIIYPLHHHHHLLIPHAIPSTRERPSTFRIYIYMHFRYRLAYSDCPKRRNIALGLPSSSVRRAATVHPHNLASIFSNTNRHDNVRVLSTALPAHTANRHALGIANNLYLIKYASTRVDNRKLAGCFRTNKEYFYFSQHTCPFYTPNLNSHSPLHLQHVHNRHNCYRRLSARLDPPA